jgi:hypothetical protein
MVALSAASVLPRQNDGDLVDLIGAFDLGHGMGRTPLFIGHHRHDRDDVDIKRRAV